MEAWGKFCEPNTGNTVVPLARAKRGEL
jgi:hypothetical protein